MKAVLAGAFALALPVCLAAAAEHADTWQRTFPLNGPGERKLDVSVINGNIHVTGDNGQGIRVTVRESYKADTPEALALVRDYFKLHMVQEGNLVRLYLDPPKMQGSGRKRGRIDFRHDVELRVPSDIAVALRTINGQDLTVANLSGTWELKNINGQVQMNDMGGHGKAETINGTVRATFTRNPSQASAFKTLNGTIDVSFPPDLSADFALSTMQGEAYTDFEVAAVTGGMETRRTGEGFRHRISDRSKKVRVGNGGVVHTLSTLNGSIKIRKNSKV